ncbi:hypothetical protein pb186bvf_016100 [Paramecium bursaria]
MIQQLIRFCWFRRKIHKKLLEKSQLKFKKSLGQLMVFRFSFIQKQNNQQIHHILCLFDQCISTQLKLKQTIQILLNFAKLTKIKIYQECNSRY